METAIFCFMFQSWRLSMLFTARLPSLPSNAMHPHAVHIPGWIPTQLKPKLLQLGLLQLIGKLWLLRCVFGFLDCSCLGYMGTLLQLERDLCLCKMQRTAPLCSSPSTFVMSHFVQNRSTVLVRPCCAVAARIGTLPEVAPASSYLTGGQEGPERQRLFDRIAPVYDQVCPVGPCRHA